MPVCHLYPCVSQSRTGWHFRTSFNRSAWTQAVSSALLEYLYWLHGVRVSSLRLEARFRIATVLVECFRGCSRLLR